MRHAFTVDVEDWYHGIPIGTSAWARAEPRLDVGLRRLLDLLARTGVRGTFFVLGPVAVEHPRLVREIADAGHEIGCHGWSHDLLYDMTPERMREETRQAVAALTDVLGKPVHAYRAAYFSVTRSSWWALAVLAELGFRYDSSIFPVRNWRYGIPDFDPRPQWIDTPGGRIAEFPISIRRVMGRNLPVSGGAYLRLYPYALTRSCYRAAEAQGRAALCYVHPWELDPEHPRVRFHWKAWLTHYANLGSTETKLRRLVADFSFGPLGEVLEHELGGPHS